MEDFKDLRIVDGNGELHNAEEVIQSAVASALSEDAERRKAISAILKEKESYSTENYISCLDEEILKVIPLLKLEEAGLVMRLLAYMSKEDGVIRDKNGYVHMDKIVKIAGKPERTVKRYVDSLVDVGILVKDGKVGRKVIYAFSQQIHSRKGGYKDYFTKIWLSNLRERWSLMPLDTLGFLYRVMPHFNTYSCCLSADPYEYEVSRSLPFSMNALAEVLGMNIRDVRKHINLLARKNMIIKISVGKTFIICVNPQIFYRQPVKNGETIARDFELLFKQADFVLDNAEEILEMRKFLALADNITKAEGVH